MNQRKEENFKEEKFCPKNVSLSLLSPRQSVVTRSNLHKVCAQLEMFPMLFCQFHVQTQHTPPSNYSSNSSSAVIKSCFSMCLFKTLFYYQNLFPCCGMDSGQAKKTFVQCNYKVVCVYSKKNTAKFCNGCPH